MKRLNEELAVSKEVGRMAGNRCVAEAAAAAVMKEREEKAVSELVVVRRQVCTVCCGAVGGDGHGPSDDSTVCH